MCTYLYRDANYTYNRCRSQPKQSTLKQLTKQLQRHGSIIMQLCIYIHFLFQTLTVSVGERTGRSPVVLNLGVSDKAHHNDDRQEPLDREHPLTTLSHENGELGRSTL